MNGPALAVLGAIFFAVSTIFMRRAVIQIPDATLGVLVSVPTGVFFFLLIMFCTNQTGLLAELSWQEIFFFSAAGILQFAVYRSFMYSCVKLVGANITSALRRIRTIVAVILGVSILGEPVSFSLILGVALIIFGIFLAGSSRQHFRINTSLSANMPRKALLWGIAGGIAGGMSPVLIKFGLGGSASALGGVFISHLAASFALAVPLISRIKRRNLVDMPATTIILFVLVGVLVAIANLARYLALDLAPASVVAPLFSTSPVFLVGLSFLFNRKIEVFSRSVIIGVITVVIGSVLLV